jgi:hypothetical protein
VLACTRVRSMYGAWLDLHCRSLLGACESIARPRRATSHERDKFFSCGLQLRPLHPGG